MAWTVQYECDVEPPAATPAWTLIGSDATTAAGGIITIDTTDSYCNYLYAWSADNATGWTIEIRAKVTSIGEVSGADVRCPLGGDGTRYERIKIFTDRIELDNDGSPSTHTMDTTDDFHVYRLTVIGSVAKTYVDGVLRLTTTATANPTDAIYFGDASGSVGDDADIEFDYVYWDETGANPPGVRRVMLIT